MPNALFSISVIALALLLSMPSNSAESSSGPMSISAVEPISNTAKDSKGRRCSLARHKRKARHKATRSCHCTPVAPATFGSIEPALWGWKPPYQNEGSPAPSLFSTVSLNVVTPAVQIEVQSDAAQKPAPTKPSAFGHLLREFGLDDLTPIEASMLLGLIAATVTAGVSLHTSGRLRSQEYALKLEEFKLKKREQALDLIGMVVENVTPSERGRAIKELISCAETDPFLAAKTVADILSRERASKMQASQ